jgi:bifunctional non-homologous end joining protein LigD
MTEGRIVPMLATAFDGGASARTKFLSEKGYLYELKLDGVRILASPAGLHYRSGRSATDSFPEVNAAFAKLSGAPVLDGEIVAFDEQGRPNFERLSRRLHGRPRLLPPAVVFVAFDLLEWKGASLESLPLTERLAQLASCLPGVDANVLRLQTSFGDGTALFQFCEANDLEGVIRKRAASVYHRGPRRTTEWMKLKRTQEDDFVVVAIVKGDTRVLGALDLASIRNGVLYYEGRAGSGLDDATLDSMAEMLKSDAVTPYTLAGPPPESGERSFVRPSRLVRVRYLGRTSSGLLRHAVFRGFRSDLDV